MTQVARHLRIPSVGHPQAVRALTAEAVELVHSDKVLSPWFGDKRYKLVRIPWAVGIGDKLVLPTARIVHVQVKVSVGGNVRQVDFD